MLQSIGSQRVRHGLVTEQQHLSWCLQKRFSLSVSSTLILSFQLTLFGNSDILLLYKIMYTGQQCCLGSSLLSLEHWNICFTWQTCPDTDTTFFMSPLSINSCYVSSVQFSHSAVSDSLWPHELQHARPPCPSQTPRVYSNSCPSSWWCHPAISSSVVPFSFCPQSLQASGSFPMSQLFAWGGQSIWASASASVLPMNTQDLSPSG